MKKGVIFLFFIIFLSFLILSYADFALAAEECGPDKPCPKGQVCVKGKCERALEITYPVIIPGEPVPKYVSTGLPVYINYIFRVSIWIIGILIFGALIYSGVSYLTSFGNPAKLSEAKKGIFSAFLGGIILLSAYLIFNTINPQLVILEPAEIELIEPTIIPGIYLCNYQEGKIKDILEKYTSGDKDKRLEAAKEFKKIVDPGKKERCELQSFSKPLEIKIKRDSNTIFAVPRENPDPGAKEKWIYDYGIVLHERDNFSGKCKLLPEREPAAVKAEENYMIYHQFEDSDFHYDIGFDVKSVTIFTKVDIPEAAEGVRLFEGFGYNEFGKEEEKKGIGEKCTSDEECASGLYCAETGDFLGTKKCAEKKKLGEKCLRAGECASNCCPVVDAWGNRKCSEPEKCKGSQLFPLPFLAQGVSKFWPKSFEVFAQVMDPKLVTEAFRPDEADVRMVTEAMLENAKANEGERKGLYHNTYSIRFHTKDTFVAVLLGHKDKKERDEKKYDKCEVRTKNDPNLSNYPIGQCGSCSKKIEKREKQIKAGECYSCLKKMYVIRGRTL